jgi:hypothetical protein
VDQYQAHVGTFPSPRLGSIIYHSVGSDVRGETNVVRPALVRGRVEVGAPNDEEEDAVFIAKQIL